MCNEATLDGLGGESCRRTAVGGPTLLGRLQRRQERGWTALSRRADEPSAAPPAAA